MTAAASRFVVPQVEGRHLGTGLALPYLAARQPFAAFQAGELTRTVAGQILRGHRLMAFDANRLVGDHGWAWTLTASIDALVSSGRRC